MKPSLPQFLFLFLFLFLLLLPHSSISQTLQGKVINAKGEPVPYVTIYCKALKKGANANEDGTFKLQLEVGKQELSFSSIDYKQKIVVQEIIAGVNELTVQMEEQNYLLQEVQVGPKATDPAVYIMRKAIGAAPYYKRQVLKYKARVYIKGTGKLESAPKLIENLISTDAGKIEVGKTYVTESINELEFSQPSTYREKVISLKSSMPFKDVPQPMTMARGSFYSTQSTDLISPLSPQAFSVYKFTLLGSFYENGKEINKIKVTPKRKGADLIEGHVYIVEDLWCLHSLVYNSKQSGVSTTLKAEFRQLPDEPLVWMPVTYDFTFSGGFMGVKGYFRYLGSVSNYKVVLNPNVSHDWLEPKVTQTKTVTPTKNQQKIEQLLEKEELNKREMLELASRMKKEAEKETKQLQMVNDSSELVVDSTATLKDSSFWNANRPVPLMKEEAISLGISDTITRKPTDSLQHKKKSFQIGNLFGVGDSIYQKGKPHYFAYSSVYRTARLNTVEGLSLGGSLRWGSNVSKRWYYAQYYQIPLVRLIPQTSGEFFYLFDPTRRGAIRLKAGTELKDFNPMGASRLVDAFQLLAMGNNFSKWYMQSFAQMGLNRELANGLSLALGAAWYQRNSLDNALWFEPYQGQRNYTDNKPFDAPAMEAHQSIQLNARIELRPFQQVKVRNNQKLYLANNWPLLSATYTHAFSSDLQFNRAELSVRQDVDVWHWLNLKYEVQGGLYFNTPNLYEADYKYFAANRSFIYDGNAFGRFQDLPYYSLASRDRYLALFTQATFKRLLLMRLPYLNLLQWKEAVYYNQLVSDNHPQVYEFGYRVTEIAGFLGVGVNHSISKAFPSYTSIRLSLTF